MQEQEELLSPEETRRRCGGISRAAMDRLVKAGLFAQPVVVLKTNGGKPVRIAYVRSKVAAWIEERVNGAALVTPRFAGRRRVGGAVPGRLRDLQRPT